MKESRMTTYNVCVVNSERVRNITPDFDTHICIYNEICISQYYAHVPSYPKTYSISFTLPYYLFIKSSARLISHYTLQVIMRIGDGRGQWAGFEREEWNKGRFLTLMRGKDGVRKVLECACTVSTGVLTTCRQDPSLQT